MFVTGIVGYCDLSADNADNVLKRHAKSKRMRGIRQNMVGFQLKEPMFFEPEHNYLIDKNWIEGFGLLEKYNMSFDLNIMPPRMKQ